MQEAIGALGFLVLGLGSLALWIASRRNSGTWDRNVRAFSSAAPRRFAWGFAGSSVLVAIGLIAQGGSGLFLTFVGQGWLADADQQLVSWLVRQANRVIVYAPILYVAGVVVAWVGRPALFFPPHARDTTDPTIKLPR